MAIDIIGYEGLYTISSEGQVYSRPRKGTKGGILPSIKDEYLEIVLTKKGKSKRYSIHRLVAIHFIPNPRNMPQVNHKDGNKHNPHYTNLEWCNQSENQKHAYSMGLDKPKRGEFNGMAKLTNRQVEEIRAIANKRGRNYNRKQIAETYMVSESTVKDIVNNKSYV